MRSVLAYSASPSSPSVDLSRQHILPRTVRTWSDGAAGIVGPVTVDFITASDAATMKAADARRVRRQKTRVTARMESEAREPLIRGRADDLVASGFTTSRKEAWHVARREVLKDEIANVTRRRLPRATEDGIRRRVAREMDIRAAVNERGEAVRDRLENGYRWEGGVDPATGRETEVFVYAGLRSDEHIHLKLFASCLPKARPWAKDFEETELKQSLKVGTKELTKAVGSKLLGLDEVYVEGQKSVRGFIRIDCDGTFSSWDACRLALLDALDGPDLLPHIAVGDELSDGRVLHPHFLWLLPEQSRIRFDSNGLPGPQALFHAVARALTAATIPVGGDVGGLSNLMRVKNPLSPHWATAIMNARDPMTLGDLAVRLEPWMRSDTAEMAERQVAVRGAAIGIGECASNQFFRETTTVCWRLARQWLGNGDERGLLQGDDLASAFVEALGHDARHAMSSVPPRRAMSMLQSVCRWAARRTGLAWPPGGGRKAYCGNASRRVAGGYPDSRRCSSYRGCPGHQGGRRPPCWRGVQDGPPPL